MLLEQVKGMVNSNEQHYEDLLKFEKVVQEKEIQGIPEVLKGNRQARVYFGLFKQRYSEQELQKRMINEVVLTELALKVDEVVQQAFEEFSIVPAEVEKRIRHLLIEPLFHRLGKEEALSILDDVLTMTRKR